MAIGEVFLGAFITVLLERLASCELLKFLRPTGVDVHLKKWHRTLLIIKAVITDAENKQTINKAVNEWLKDLEDLAYDLDDIVDELNTEALQRKLTENEATTSKLSGGYPEVVSFAKDDNNGEHYLLPSSVTELWLTDMPNLENLKGFENLTSLRILWIIRCSKLVELPVEDQLNKLWSLEIDECPFIKKRCLKNRGGYYPIIADIPHVRIDGHHVHDPYSSQ